MMGDEFDSKLIIAKKSAIIRQTPRTTAPSLQIQDYYT